LNEPAANDACDADGGSNNGQNFPNIFSATPEGGGTRVIGKLNSTASTTFDIDFYENPACTRFPFDFIEGKTWIATHQVTTDGSCLASINVLLPAVAPGAQISATATDPSGNTSEFSQRLVIDSAPRAGDPSGGQNVSVQGMLFEDGMTATVGGVSATVTSVTGPTSAQITAPARLAGSVSDITVTTPSGFTGTFKNGYVAQFTDAIGSGFAIFIAQMVADGLTAGCGGGNYCVTSPVTRAQMSVFLLRARYGLCYVPPPATGTVFADVSTSAFAAAWIEALSALGVTGGCGGGNFCPSTGVTRAQKAVFLLRTKDGPTYVPPACTSPMFADVPCSSPFAKWINELARRGVTAGCGGGNYCPDSIVTRGQMAVFLVTNFALP
jgi:hypothetical protein